MSASRPRVLSPAAVAVFVSLLSLLSGERVSAADGPLGIDHRLNYDDSGIWARRNQTIVLDGVMLTVAAGALWEGRDSRLGSTLWKSVDALAIGALTSESMKYAFSRSRPMQSDDPNLWFQGHGHKSFPSGEVTAITAAVTPVILEYGSEQPAAWALAALPVYDSVARMKVQAHWQTDVLAGICIGAAVGAYAHSRSESLSVGLLPGAITVGWKVAF